MKHDPLTTANAAATTTAVVYVICRVLIGLFPDISFAIAQSWFHGIELQKFGTWGLTTSNFVLGLVSATVVAWLIGWCFAHCYNMFLKKQK